MTDDEAARMDAAWQKLAQVRENAQATKDVLSKELPAISVEGDSPDGAVHLAVNVDGVLTELRLGEQVRKMTPDRIAEAVLRTYAEAQRTAAQQAAELLRPFGGNTYLQDRFAWRQEFAPYAEPEPEPADLDALPLTVLRREW
ncbi:YbaB/EbfC family nucleoid-associated protein [Sciscionella sediminilitoris]|uniref:YbaB/EbfC family nucleoid-associated protein n=1 Tax=Sciscionella sediminilitoris TaxID=1445613 RepID=UPI00068B8B64|nr:YbaB/EbfC family nucleoid-associated protein [Sciscionella sp. SE31]